MDVVNQSRSDAGVDQHNRQHDAPDTAQKRPPKIGGENIRVDDHARTNREAELDPGTEEEEFVPPDQCQSHGHGQRQGGPGGDDTDGHPVGHPPREQGHRSGAAGVTGEREGYQLDIEPILDPVGYPVDAGAALGYPGQGKGQKQFSHDGGPERHRHHDSDGGPTCCVYKRLGDGQEEDATDAQTGGSQGQGQPHFPLEPFGQGD